MTPEQEYFDQFFRMRILYLRMDKAELELRLLGLMAENVVQRLNELFCQLNIKG